MMIQQFSVEAHQCGLFNKNKLVVSIDDIYDKILSGESGIIFSQRISVILYLVKAMRNRKREVAPGLFIIVKKFKQCYDNNDFSTIVDQKGNQLFNIDEVKCLANDVVFRC